MGKTFLGLACLLAACGDNYDYDSQSPTDASSQVDGRAIDAPSTDSALQLQILTPTPYLRREDSPFKDLATWHVEDFEDHLLDDVPGVTDNGGLSKAGAGAPTLVDSVDNDDGAINDQCMTCDSWFHAQGELRFTFAGPDLPTHAGVVWTDASAVGLTVTFEAFDAQGASLGTVSLPNHSDSANQGETAEDRFFGVIASGGVGSISIKNLGAIEVDHLQWGR